MKTCCQNFPNMNCFQKSIRSPFRRKPQVKHYDIKSKHPNRKSIVLFVVTSRVFQKNDFSFLFFCLIFDGLKIFQSFQLFDLFYFQFDSCIFVNSDRKKVKHANDFTQGCIAFIFFYLRPSEAIFLDFIDLSEVSFFCISLIFENKIHWSRRK